LVLPVKSEQELSPSDWIGRCATSAAVFWSHLPVREFELNPGKKEEGIGCGFVCRPWFGDGDIGVSDNCNANRNRLIYQNQLT
jgi:hypothetical protein